jgi:hypothetical protein
MLPPFEVGLLFPPLLVLLCCPIKDISPATTCSDACNEFFNNGHSEADTFSEMF